MTQSIIPNVGTDESSQFNQNLAIQALHRAVSGAREVLVAARTYYVRTDGADTNNGLSDTAEGAFLTVQKAINVVAALDISIYDVTITVAAGTYNSTTSVNAQVTGPWVGSGTVTLTGAGATSILRTTTARVVYVINGGRLTINGFKLVSTSGNLMDTGVASAITVGANMTFADSAIVAGTGQHIVAAVPGSFIALTQNYTIAGGGQIHWSAQQGGSVQCVTRTITLSNTPAFSFAFALCRLSANMRVNSNTYSGSATGKQYVVDQTSTIYALTATLPGSTAGTEDLATFGKYISS